MLYLTAEDYTNMSYYNLCGISYRSQHSNISKRKKRGGGGGGGTCKKNHRYARLQ